MSKTVVRDLLDEAGFSATVMEDILEGNTPEAMEMRRILAKMIKAEFESIKDNGNLYFLSAFSKILRSCNSGCA